MHPKPNTHPSALNFKLLPCPKKSLVARLKSFISVCIEIFNLLIVCFSCFAKGFIYFLHVRICLPFLWTLSLRTRLTLCRIPFRGLVPRLGYWVCGIGVWGIGVLGFGVLGYWGIGVRTHATPDVDIQT